MLSIEEIKLLIEKLEKLKGTDFQKLIDSNLKILKDLETAVDANNDEQIERVDKRRIKIEFFCILQVSCHSMPMLQSLIVYPAFSNGYDFSYAHDTNCLRLW